MSENRRVSRPLSTLQLWELVEVHAQQGARRRKQKAQIVYVFSQCCSNAHYKRKEWEREELSSVIPAPRLIQHLTDKGRNNHQNWTLKPLSPSPLWPPGLWCCQGKQGPLRGKHSLLGPDPPFARRGHSFQFWSREYTRHTIHQWAISVLSDPLHVPAGVFTIAAPCFGGKTSFLPKIILNICTSSLFEGYFWLT